MKQMHPHIPPETDVLFEEFMTETDSLDTVSTDKELSNVSPSSLLVVLNEAKALIGSLQSEKQLNSQSNEINSRLTHLEKELFELKEIIAHQE